MSDITAKAHPDQPARLNLPAIIGKKPLSHNGAQTFRWNRVPKNTVGNTLLEDVYDRRQLDGRWDKNDTKDAANVADLISRGRCLYYNAGSAQINQLRDLLSHRRRLKKEEHSLRMRIRNTLLAKYFPELDRFYSTCESDEALAAYRIYVTVRGKVL